MRWFLVISFVVFLAFAVKANDPTCPCNATGQVVVPPKVMPGPGPTVKVTPAPKAKVERQHKVLKFLRHPLHRKCR